MLAVRIFRHSVRQVTGNWEAALRISAVPTLALFAVSFLLRSSLARDAANMAAPPGPGELAGGLLLVVLQAVIGAWIAVAWHRYVLLNEQPDGVLPPLHTDRLQAYIARMLLIGVITAGLFVLTAVAASLLGTLLGAGRGPGIGIGVVLGLVVALGISVLLQRLSLLLPAAAVGKPASLRMAWDATRGQAGMFLMLSILWVVAAVVVVLPGVLLMHLGLALLATAWQVAVQLGLTLLFLSILTTLYGHFVERRALV